jgi:membrane protein required for colicin V production
MSIQLLDVILAVILLISAVLALARGFTREVLSLLAWGLAAVAGLYAALNPELVRFAGQYLQPEMVAKIAVGAGAFLIVLIILSMISVRIADWVLDSAAGPFDRTLGLVYGLARGLALVVIAYLFYVWLVPPEKREDWVRNAQSLPFIEAAGEFVTDFLPADIRDTLRTRIAAAGTRQQQAQPGAAEGDEGYRTGDTTVLDQLIESTQSGRNNPAPQQPAAPSQQEAPTQQEDVPAFGGQTSQD